MLHNGKITGTVQDLHDNKITGCRCVTEHAFYWRRGSNTDGILKVGKLLVQVSSDGLESHVGQP